MKLQIPEGYRESTVINLGKRYPVDKRGHVTIPDADVHDGLYADGFTVVVEPGNIDAKAGAIEPKNKG